MRDPKTTQAMKTTRPRVQALGTPALYVVLFAALLFGCATSQTGSAWPAQSAPSAGLLQGATEMVSVVPVHNIQDATAWYTDVFGRGPDLVPTEGVAEWQLAPGGWLQLSAMPEPARHATVFLEGLAPAGSNPCPPMDNARTSEPRCTLVDPSGNKLHFQPTSHSQTNAGPRRVVAAFPTAQLASAVAWYSALFGRAPDAQTHTMAEWRVHGSGWLRLIADERTSASAVALTVRHVELNHRSFQQADLRAGDVQDYGVVKLFEVSDPFGHTIIVVEPQSEVAPESTADR